MVEDVDLDIKEDLRATARSGPSRKSIFFDEKTGDDFWRDGQKWVKRRQVVDKKNDRYFKHVEDPDTGQVLRHCEEPLSVHHGRAKARLAPCGMSDGEDDA